MKPTFIPFINSKSPKKVKKATRPEDLVAFPATTIAQLLIFGYTSLP